ncbi:MAG: SpoIIE family protein phosphatase [Planctomycetaceae bacterium]
MPFLRVEQGSVPGQILEVSGERVVIGRHPSCEIVLDNAAVSRHHAQISESHGAYYLEDLRSRNRTFVNGLPVDVSTELRDGDEIQLCDLSFRFLVEPPSDGLPRTGGVFVEERLELSKTPSRPSDVVGTADGDGAVREWADERRKIAETVADADVPLLVESGSSILSTVPVGDASSLLLTVKPEQKLRAVLDIGRSLGHALELGEVLDRTLDSLFRVFPQADQGFVLLKEGERSGLRLRAERSRREGQKSRGVSMTVVRRALSAGEAILSADIQNDPRFSESDSIAAMALRSFMCVPLIATPGEPFGVVQLDCADANRPFSKDDLDVLASVAGQIGLAVENVRLHSELVAQRDMQRELDFAMQVQLGFLPSHPPTVPAYEFFDYYEAAQRVGGDYFDYVELADGRIAVTVGDVAGKGVPAALLMARLFASARYQLLTRSTPGEALASLNAEIARTALGHRFITCLFAVLDPKSHTVTVANAGHMAPLIRSADGKVVPLGQKDSGMPIGIARDQDFVEVSYGLAPGDTFLMYTDGVTEAMSPDSELYGRERLVHLLRSGSKPIRDLIELVVSDVARFVGDRPQRDDICLVGFRRLPE